MVRLNIEEEFSAAPPGFERVNLQRFIRSNHKFTGRRTTFLFLVVTKSNTVGV